MRSNEFLHSWYLFVVIFFSLVFLFFNPSIFLNIILVTVLIVMCIKNGLPGFVFLKLFIYALFFSFGIFVLNVFHPAVALKNGEIYQILNFTLYKLAIERGVQTFIKLFFISLVSMSSAFVIDYTKVILYLMIHKGLKLFWGYPLLLAMNSIALFKEEFDRIKINAKLRGLPLKDQVSLLFPLLVFAIRHSQRGALSLVTRGLNQKKTFYNTYDLSTQDRMILFFFGLFYFALVALAVMKLH